MPIVATGQSPYTSLEIHSVIAFFCDRVRALKNPTGCFYLGIFSDKRPNPAVVRPTRVFHVSYTFYPQRYPQVVRC